MLVDDYDVLSILGNNIKSSTYKVKHKKTGNILVWQTVDYKSKNHPNRELLFDNIKKRICISHPNIITFHNYIDQKENKILYLVTEYCENGSLKSLINSCLTNDNCISEELVCKILYQIAFTVKTVKIHFGKLSMNEIFLDEDFNIKLFNFKLDNKNDTLKETKMYHLGSILFEICTFKNFNEQTYENELNLKEKVYSHSLLSLISSLINDKTELRQNVNKILCHPTVLLKSTQWLKERCFINIENSEKFVSLKNTKHKDETMLFTSKLEKLRNKEASLQVREQQLHEREYKLILKEKKIALMERAVKEKLQQAELSLKRCRESKSLSSDSAKSTTSIQKQKKLSYDNLDSTYVSCGDSIILPTSSKLNVNKIVKPAPFTRTLSERRIRFKGHSPLKEIDYNKKIVKQSKLQRGNVKKNSDWWTCSEDTDKSSMDGNSKGTNRKAKQLFSARNVYENENLINSDTQCKPITWTEENKRYAFELLRAMNIDKENQCLEIKHTCL